MKCKKLVYRRPNQNRDYGILLGIISKEDDHLIVFKTSRREYSINKSVIVTITDTDETFRGDLK